KASDLFVVASDPLCEFFDSDAQGGDVFVEAVEGAGRCAGSPVVFDEGAERGVAVESGAGDVRGIGDGGEGDRLVIVGELDAGLLDARWYVVHPVWACAIAASSRSMSLRWRSASLIQPRCSASLASVSVSARWAARTGR